MKRNVRKIRFTEEKMNEGIELCVNKAKQLLADAKLLAERSNVDHACGFYLFALEEFGKALLLKESSVEGKSRIVPCWIFGNDRAVRDAHDRKIARALSDQDLPFACRMVGKGIKLKVNINPKSTTIDFDDGTAISVPPFLTGKFELSGAGNVGYPDFQTRMGCFYTDWDFT